MSKPTKKKEQFFPMKITAADRADAKEIKKDLEFIYRQGENGARIEKRFRNTLNHLVENKIIIIILQKKLNIDILDEAFMKLARSYKRKHAIEFKRMKALLHFLDPKYIPEKKRNKRKK